MTNNDFLEKKALKIKQGENSFVYSFSLTHTELNLISDVSRIKKDDTGKLIGYQRSVVKKHVQDIVSYLKEENIIFPNAIILALSSDVKFKASRGPKASDVSTVTGTICIPIPKNGNKKPGWIVDGQQRTHALFLSNKIDLPVFINAFITDNVGEQKEQFLRINNVKPLPRGLISELLPEISTPLPSKLSAKKIPSALCNLLNDSEQSPFHRQIKRTSMDSQQRKEAVITDTSIINMIQESFSSPTGCLFPYRNIATGETDIDSIYKILLTYWTTVKEVFPTEWGKPASKSRLMHGAGIRAMGRLMDKIMATQDLKDENLDKNVKIEIEKIAPFCRWSSGKWEELGYLGWNEIQNVPKHISLLSNFLIRKHAHLR